MCRKNFAAQPKPRLGSALHSNTTPTSTTTHPSISIRVGLKRHTGFFTAQSKPITYHNKFILMVLNSMSIILIKLVKSMSTVRKIKEESLGAGLTKDPRKCNHHFQISA